MFISLHISLRDYTKKKTAIKPSFLKCSKELIQVLL